MAIPGDKTLTPTGTVSGTGTKTIGFDWGKNQGRAQVTKEYIVTSNDNGVTVNNKLIVHQQFTPLAVNETSSTTATIAYEATGAARTITFSGEANGKQLRVIGTPATTFTGYTATEYSAGPNNGAPVSTSYANVSNFEGGSTFYDFDMVIPVPDRQQEGTYTVTASTMDDAQSTPVAAAKTFSFTINPPIMLTTHLYAVYKSDDESAETLSCDFIWKKGGDAGAGTTLSGNVYTTAGSTDYAYHNYGNTIQTMLIDASTDTLKLKCGASFALGSKTLSATAAVYAHECVPDGDGNPFIIDGDFINQSASIGSIDVMSTAASGTEFTVNLPAIRSQLNLDDGDEVDIYVLFDTATPPAPVSPVLQSEIAQVEVERNDVSVLKGKIGYNLLVSNYGMQRTYKSRISLHYTGDPVEIDAVGQTIEGDGYVDYVLYDDTSSPRTVAADSAYSVAADIANNTGISISSILSVSGESYTDAEIMDFVWDKMDFGEMSFKFELWLNDSMWASHPVYVDSSSNKLVKVQTDN